MKIIIKAVALLFQLPKVQNIITVGFFQGGNVHILQPNPLDKHRENYHEIN